MARHRLFVSLSIDFISLFVAHFVAFRSKPIAQEDSCRCAGDQHGQYYYLSSPKRRSCSKSMDWMPMSSL